MGNLKGRVRRTGRSGNFVYATLENISNGKATVILSGSDQKLINLQVLTDSLERGDRVIVDYSGGIPPIVRGVGQATTVEESQFVEDFLDFEITPELAPSDISVSVIGRGHRIITKESGNLLSFDTAIFDEQSMFSAPYYFIVPTDGVYYASAQIIVDSITSDYSPSNKVWMALDGNEYGTFAIETAVQHEHSPTYPIQAEVNGVITARAGESVSCRAWLDASFAQNSADIIEEGVGPYAAVSPVFQMVRLGGDYPEENLFHIEFPSYYDPSDIDIQENRGFMFTSEPLSYARAIANSKSQSDQELTLDFKWSDTTAESYLSLFLRTSVDWYGWSFPTDGYELQISNTGGWSVWKYDGGTQTILGSVNSPGTEQWQRLRFQVSSDKVRVKVWLKDGSEPGSWEFDYTDGSPLGAGGFQLGHFNQGGARSVKIDDVNLDTP